ncbi:hypothetical protein SAMN05444344_1972 [Tenacibaculum mesophilum]|uniref:Gliding motility-associated lipoprotein GldH n=2 Tax=Tenacibaculum mesophilum TaxID=104268 RepID=A0ABN5T4G0_9FLAO|nr:hypothetical protein [Tenacibaculum mesophilum]AZJ32116.1 hypothetical protein D6200_05830 [Tenacibaculum mesophilum]QFS27376.1 hypothetical protein F9Y86_02700 [Tenacibaculum mesophilum]SHF90239.1 hypothetical protein SAMN05444344_1972 [Tenacibaculum mesophilum]
MKHLYIILIFFIFCGTNKDIKITSKPSEDSEVIAWYDNESKKIWAISLPFDLNIKSSGNKFLYHFQYKYKKSDEGAVIKMYFISDEKLVRLENYKKRKFNNQKNKSFLFYTKHLIIDEDESKKILSKIDTTSIKADSLFVGNFYSFSRKFPKITKNLIDGDTLYLRFKEIEGVNKERIKVPIKIN